MRIIAGELGGRRLLAPKGQGTRPMLERVREAVFSTLEPWFLGAHVLDLFAGSGSLCLEALSRGASSAVALEQDRRVLAVLAKNVEQLGCGERLVQVGGNALDPRLWGPKDPDLVFLDPPYPVMQVPEGRRQVSAAVERLLERLAPEGVVVWHVPRYLLSSADLPRACEHRLREYGTQAIWYLQRG